MFRKRIILAFTLAILIAFATVSIALAEITFIIDHFDTDQALSLTYSGTLITDSNTINDGEVLGDYRDIVGTILIGQGGESLSITSNIYCPGSTISSLIFK